MSPPAPQPIHPTTWAVSQRIPVLGAWVGGSLDSVGWIVMGAGLDPNFLRDAFRDLLKPEQDASRGLRFKGTPLQPVALADDSDEDAQGIAHSELHPACLSGTRLFFCFF